MVTIVLVIHCFIVVALVGVVLMQRSEGGALSGLGGGGGGGGFMSGRGAANALTRTTTILAALFFSTSLGLAVFADRGNPDATLADEILGEGAGAATAPLTPGEVSGDDLLQGFETGSPDADEDDTATEPDPAAPEQSDEQSGSNDEDSPAQPQ